MKVLFSVYNISGYLLAELKALSSYAEIVVIETPCNIEKGELAKTVKWIDRRSLKTAHDIEVGKVDRVSEYGIVRFVLHKIKRLIGCLIDNLLPL